MSQYLNMKTCAKQTTHRLCAGVVPGPSERSAQGRQGLAAPNPCTALPAFTLIELLVVVVIILIASMTAIPMMSSATTLQIRSAANVIAADLEYAKSMAISRGQYFSVVFDQNAESYQIQNQSGNVIPHPVKKGFNYVVDFRNDSRLNRVDIVSVAFNSGDRVKFDYLGSPYDGSTPPQPLNTGVITIRAGSVTKTVTVEPVTGYISISD